MYFITEGTWAVCFTADNNQNERAFYDIDDDVSSIPPSDVSRRHLIRAKLSPKPNYIGDYYCINQKKANYTYVAWNSTVLAFALSKKFLYKSIFEKYPQLLTDMKGSSFLRYTYEFKKPIVISLC